MQFLYLRCIHLHYYYFILSDDSFSFMCLIPFAVFSLWGSQLLVVTLEADVLCLRRYLNASDLFNLIPHIDRSHPIWLQLTCLAQISFRNMQTYEFRFHSEQGDEFALNDHHFLYVLLRVCNLDLVVYISIYMNNCIFFALFDNPLCHRLFYNRKCWMTNCIAMCYPLYDRDCFRCFSIYHESHLVLAYPYLFTSVLTFNILKGNLCSSLWIRMVAR